MSEWIDKLRTALGDRRHAYRMTFRGPLAEVVLKDMARFCRAHRTTYMIDRDASLVAQGRREAWLRIAEHLNLSEDRLWELYAGTPPSES